MIRTYYCVWSYVCFCLQSSIQAANVIVDFPHSQEKTSSLFIGTNTAPELVSTHTFKTRFTLNKKLKYPRVECSKDWKSFAYNVKDLWNSILYKEITKTTLSKFKKYI